MWFLICIRPSSHRLHTLGRDGFDYGLFVGTLFWIWLSSIQQFISSVCCPYLTKSFHILDSTTPILVRILVWKLCLHISTSMSCNMPCGHRSNFSRKHSTKLLTILSSLCLFAKRVCIEISVSSLKKRYRNSSTSDHDLIVSGGNYINYINLVSLKVLVKTLVIIGSFPMEWPIYDKK